MTHTLEAGTGGSGFRASITTRVAAHVALTRFLCVYDRTPQFSRVGRFFGRDVLTTALRPLFVELRGELAIADALEALDSDWTVFHAVQLASRESAIDHLIIGPGGVFALTVAHHSDQSVRVADGDFEVAGSRHNHIRNSEFEVGCVERLLGAALGETVTATGLVVVVDPRSVVVSDAPRDVTVVSSKDLMHWLQHRPLILSAADVDRLVRGAECPATWMNATVVLDDGDHLRARFSDIARSVRAADTIRRVWIVATVTAIAATFTLWAIALMVFDQPVSAVF